MSELNLEKFFRSSHYKIRMINPQYGTVSASLMEPLVVSTSGSWSAMADQSSDGGILDLGAQYFKGRSMVIGEFTTQKWAGQNEIEINVKIGFVAIKNAKSEVQDIVAELLQWPLTPQIDTLLKTPLDVFGGEYITLQSKSFLIKELLPVSVTPTFSQVKSPDGHPIWATVDLVFKTSRAVTGPEVRGWFR